MVQAPPAKSRAIDTITGEYSSTSRSWK